MRVHFIAIGGSAMHNLAIAMKIKGYQVTGSDDEIFEPSKSRLDKYDILPTKMGWDENNITPDLDAVILGMHARLDNPELLKAQELGLKIYSFPEYLYEQSKEKTRIVIGGSHGKTSITAMILHVFKECHIACDYMVGAQLDGFEVMVKLSESAKYMIIEGDEYLTSPIDRRPKFHLYMPHIALLSGIAWDHINVFPTFDNYVEQFRIFTDMIADGGALIYCAEDQEVVKVAEQTKDTIKKLPYSLPNHDIIDGITYLNQQQTPLLVFGDHNLQNICGAQLVCQQAGISAEDFFKAISTFKGASKRLELVDKNQTTLVLKDFAHSPSKLKATTLAVKKQFPNRTLVACMELHTFSSLSEQFLSHYHGAMNEADTAIVYFSPHALAHKKLPPITIEQVKEGFQHPSLLVFTDTHSLQEYLLNLSWSNQNLLLMSSGNFDGLPINELAKKIVNRH